MITKYVNNLTTMILLLSCVVFTACNDDILDKEIFYEESSLNLIAPSGEKIADNIVSLRNEVSQVIVQTFGIEKEFEITNLNYLPAKKGYAVVIEYETADGIAKNYLKASNVPIHALSSSAMIFHLPNPRLKNDSESSGGKRVKFECISHGNCNDCQIMQTTDPTTGNITVSCSNECCYLKTTYY